MFSELLLSPRPGAPVELALLKEEEEEEEEEEAEAARRPFLGTLRLAAFRRRRCLNVR